MSADDDYAAYVRATDARLLDTFRRQVAAGHLTRQGLMDLRHRLDGAEFAPSPARDLAAQDVSAALARRFGISPADMPGYDSAPDDISGLDG